MSTLCFEHLDLSNPFGEPPKAFLDATPTAYRVEPTSFSSAAVPSSSSAPDDFVARAQHEMRYKDSTAAPTCSTPSLSQSSHMPPDTSCYASPADSARQGSLARSAVQREAAWIHEAQQPPCFGDMRYYDDEKENAGFAMSSALPSFESTAPPPPPMLSRASSRGATTMQRSRSARDFTEAYDPMSIQPGVKRSPTTLYGGKINRFSTPVDTEHTQVIFFQDLINRDKPAKCHTGRRPGPRPAADFRQTRAWQEAYAIRERTRCNEKPRYPLQEKPRINVRALSARRPARNNYDTLEQDLSRSLGEEAEAMYSFLPETAAVVPSPLRSTGRLCDPQVSAVDSELQGGISTVDSARAGSLPVPPPVPGSLGFRSRIAEDLNLSAAVTGSRMSIGTSQASSSATTANLPAQDDSLRQMQRLLGETWRYQQLGAAATGSASSRSHSHEPQSKPLQFSAPQHGDDAKFCPPPICSDFVQVSKASSSANRDPPGESPYQFLGRLVATLPGEEPAGPMHPQAVVECNFWQMGSAGAAGVSSLGNRSHADWAVPTSSHGLALTSAPIGSMQPMSAAGRLLAEAADSGALPPWPHEM